MCFFFLRGGYDMVNQRCKSRGQYLYSWLFSVPLSGLFCVAVVQILISQMNTNIYSTTVCAPLTEDAFSALQVFVGAAGCSAETLQRWTHTHRTHLDARTRFEKFASTQLLRAFKCVEVVNVCRGVLQYPVCCVS